MFIKLEYTSLSLQGRDICFLMKDINCYLNQGQFSFKVKFKFCAPFENRKLKASAPILVLWQ